ncbi:MAG: single-stranded-DNA-specific exonuclease RecJ [Deltaproteobacteria bacterium]|nr:single-stranded-DNA-specific exonuclease RecJ [Deltaproteobacteria bacterium]
MTNRLGKRWEIYQAKRMEEAFSLKELRISPLTAQILFNRGISSTDQARSFLYPALSDLPDPCTMKDMEKAVGRIFQAIRNRERITLFGDYDVDGTTAIALLFLFLQGAGALVDFYLPRRLEEGYGLNLEAIKKIHSQGTKLMITADCGISNFEEIRWAQENGLDVIVTDHHEIPEILPPALAILNPKQENCSYPFKALAGVGVAFNLTIALRSTLRQEGFWKGSSVPNLKEYLDLVALGTVSDVVPLTGVNRILAKYGLTQLTSSSRAGILALKEVSAMGSGIPVDTTAVNFRLAPRINAAGRLGDAREVVRLLISRNEAEAKEIAAHLNDLNSLRQRIEDKILGEAREMIESGVIDQRKKSFVLASVSWHPGIIGIVASRLIEEYHRPIILIALQENLGKGSGRSVDPFSLYQGLKACRSWMEKFGGHEQAAGLIIRQECIAGFSQAFEEVVAATMAEEDFIPRLSVDALSRLDQMGDPFLLELAALSPFGPGNPEPVLAMEDLTILGSKLVGKGHLRLRIREGGLTREAIGFQMGSWHPLSGGRMKMAFAPQVGFFQGRRTLQLKIVDLQPMD